MEALNLLVNDIKLKNLKLCFTVYKENIVDRDILKKISEYNLEDNIEFLGHLNLKKLNEYYSTANIVVFPSYIETVGLPLMEAASFNKKIICSDLEYAREVLAGYNQVKYVDYEDYENWSKSIYETINSLESNSLRLNFANKGWYEMIEFLNFILYGEVNEKRL
ncbi:glycosyltransferase family 4 protein [Clostridium perfringens]|nr:glycosyltransferase family 4 protein [Clostridium perfringens]